MAQMKRTPIKKQGKNKKANDKKKRDKQKELERHYDVKLTYRRYQGRKGIYWSLFSEYIRKRDFKNYGTCISCGRPFRTWKEAQAGHYAPASNCGFSLLFDERNVHAECSACNNPVFSPGKLIPYRSNLVARYGEEWVQQLDKDYEDRTITKEWTAKEYDKKIWELKDKIKELDEDT